jgi:hypothetical protein
VHLTPACGRALRTYVPCRPLLSCGAGGIVGHKAISGRPAAVQWYPETLSTTLWQSQADRLPASRPMRLNARPEERRKAAMASGSGLLGLGLKDRSSYREPTRSLLPLLQPDYSIYRPGFANVTKLLDAGEKLPHGQRAVSPFQASSFSPKWVLCDPCGALIIFSFRMTRNTDGAKALYGEGPPQMSRAAGNFACPALASSSTEPSDAITVSIR